MTILIAQPEIRGDDPELWPTPPPELMEYQESPAIHLSLGRAEFDSLMQSCASAGIDLAGARRILDFGCSNGRVTRWFSCTDGHEVWGCDIQVAKLLWAQQHLGGKLRFFVNTVEPHLPFQDGYFNLVVAQSIFTHIQEMHVAWLLELARVTSVDGHLYLTVNDARSLDPSQTPKAPRVLETVFRGIDKIASDLSKVGYLAMNAYNGPGNLAQVYMSEEYIRALIPPFLEVRAIIPRAYSNVLTAYVLRRKAA
jgi:ubiquinone/menaquinone biosynthesis C-methylase UbiE